MYRDPDQPSIFSRPDDTFAERSTPLTGHPPAPSTPPTPAQSPHGARPIEPEPTASRRPRWRRETVAIAVGGLAMLAMAGFIGASLLGGKTNDPALAAGSQSAAPTASSDAGVDGSPTAAPTSSAMPSEAATPRATAVPTPVPTPAGPPQAVTVGGWATVTVDELNVRREAGIDKTSLYRLVRGAVAHIFEGPLSRDGLDWYRVASLGGAQGWAASGPAADPFMRTFAADTDLLYCDEINSDVLVSTASGFRARDPIVVGELALPAAAFGDMEVALLELLRATHNEACFSAEIGPAGVPVMYTQSWVSACGRITGDDGTFRIRPAAGSPYGIESQVKETAVLSSGLLASDVNVGARVRLAANSADAMPCIYAGVTETTSGNVTNASVDAMQCVIVDEHQVDYLMIRDVDATVAERFSILPDQPIEPGTLGLGAPVELSISASFYGSGTGFSIWFDEDPACR